MTEITIKLNTGGILERMRNVGYRFCGVGTSAGRIYFKSKNGSTQYLYLEFKSWDEVDEFCKQKETEDNADIEEVIADMREARK